MSSRRSRTTAASILLMALIGCGPKTAGPVAVQTSAVKNLTRDGNLYIGGAPTLEGLNEVKALGVTTVIDLRRPQEAAFDEEAAARSKGLCYIRLPMAPDELTMEQADRFINVLRPHEREKVLIHCASGNRAAAMYGVYLGADKNCSSQEAIENARRAGLKNEKLTEQLRRVMEDQRRRNE